MIFFRPNRVPNEALRPTDDSQSSDEEDSPDEVSENSEFETECYESYTRKYYVLWLIDKYQDQNIFHYSIINCFLSIRIQKKAERAGRPARRNRLGVCQLSVEKTAMRGR